MFKSFSLLSWNVRGLGRSDKCDDVLSELLGGSPAIVGLQETKLCAPTPAKIRSFLPSRLSDVWVLDSNGASGGVVTTWDPSLFDLCSISHSAHTRLGHPHRVCRREHLYLHERLRSLRPL